MARQHTRAAQCSGTGDAAGGGDGIDRRSVSRRLAHGSPSHRRRGAAAEWRRSRAARTIARRPGAGAQRLESDQGRGAARPEPRSDPLSHREVQARTPVSRWTPTSILLLRDYGVAAFTADLIAGVTVGLVALPLAMAFAISSGVPPQAGLYCAVITGFLISALGGSRFQIGGPTGAFVVVVSGIVARHGIDGLFLCTLMAGGILVVLGLTGLGAVVKFLPRP